MLELLARAFNSMCKKDKKITQNLLRNLVYPYYRFEYFRLRETREKMERSKVVFKEEMKKEKNWKWLYVVEKTKDQAFMRNWKNEE